MKFLSVMLIGLIAFTSCSKSKNLGDDVSPVALLNVDVDGTSIFTKANITPVLEVTSPLTADEIEFLYALREDEKLSRDVYSKFNAKYPTAPQIARIAGAELSHIDCIEAVLAYYEIEFPTLLPEGDFADLERQNKYNELVGKGATILEAFMVMASLEEESVAAYKKIRTEIVNPNIALIMDNMIKASSNHLKAVVRQITVLNGVYIPKFLSQNDFDAIIKAGNSQGNAYGKNKGKGGDTNSKKCGAKEGKKGSVNSSGNCTNSVSGGGQGGNGKGGVGKGYRGGK